jgi:hypothetical protein
LFHRRFIRVFSGALRDGVLSGPYEVREMRMNGPVMSVSLFTNVSAGRRVCNLLAACAIGHAIVYEDLFGQPRSERVKQEVLAGSDQYETIFSALAADIDLVRSALNAHVLHVRWSPTFPFVSNRTAPRSFSSARTTRRFSLTSILNTMVAATSRNPVMRRQSGNRLFRTSGKCEPLAVSTVSRGSISMAIP